MLLFAPLRLGGSRRGAWLHGSVFLKSLTLRGFKSFADTTRLDFEPGVTVVVGPNGSGKSNLVDALTWVLGTSSPKNLRGGAMADVIFAGAPGKPGMGRARVAITIDNTAGQLPLEFSEVTVSRGMFANGEGTYTINDVECRALDVQELLSDTGLGRETHTIVGQGQLDAILNARPEQRRALVEEAAGIAKHRRRRERAVRKLAAMEAHVERVGDVLRELKRQLRPLERQAEAATKHAALSEQLIAVRRTRAVRELAALSAQLHDSDAGREQVEAALAAVEAALAAIKSSEHALEARVTRLGPEARRATEVHFRLANLQERLRGLVARIEERRNGLVEAVEEPVAGRDPAELRAEAAALGTELEGVRAEQGLAQASYAAAQEARTQGEQARRAHEQAAAAEQRRQAQAREAHLRWEGQVAALRAALAQYASEDGRLASQTAGLADHAAELAKDLAASKADIQRLDADAPGLARQVTEAEALLRRREATADAAAKAERELERRRASLEARADALRAASAEAGEGSNAVLHAHGAGTLRGILGPLADHVVVPAGRSVAVAAALGSLGDALVVADRDAARGAIDHVRAGDIGRVLLLVADRAAAPGPVEDLAALGAQPLADGLDGPAPVLAGLRRALDGCYLVADLDAALFLAGRRPELIFVTPDGDVAGARGVAGGGPGRASAVASRAAGEEAATAAEAVAGELLVAHRRVGDADQELAAARSDLDAATAAQQESDALITAAAERLRRLQHELARTTEQLDGLRARQADLEAEIAGHQGRLDALQSRGPEPFLADPRFAGQGGDLEAERLDDALAGAREREVQARLAASAVAQRAEEHLRRIAGLQAEADAVERRLADRERRRLARLDAIARCGVLADLAAQALVRTDRSLIAAGERRDAFEEDRADAQRRLGVARARGDEVGMELTRLRDDRHAAELARAELASAADHVRARLHGLGADPDAALAAATAETLGGGEEREAQLAEEEERLVRARRAARHREPAGARGVHRGQGAPRLPRDAAGRPARQPPRPLGGDRGRRRPHHRGVRARVRRRRPRVHPHLRAALPGRRGPARLGGRRPADGRCRGRGPPGRQEGQAPLAALGRRALPRRTRPCLRDLRGPPLAVLRPRRGRGRPRRRQPPALPDAADRVPPGQPAHRRHPPAPHHGDRRHALRHLDELHRHQQGRQPEGGGADPGLISRRPSRGAGACACRPASGRGRWRGCARSRRPRGGGGRGSARRARRPRPPRRRRRG